MSRTILNPTTAVVALGLSVMALSACGGAQARKAKHLEKGQTYLVAGNYEKARVEFQNALQIAPLDPEARFENGVVDEKLGKVREAAQFYQGAIDVSPDHLGARTNLARVYLFAGGPDKALDLIKPALERHPDNSELLTLRAAARVQKNELGEGQADAERAVRLDPQNEDAVSALAGIYISTKATDKARSLLEDAINRIPSTVDLRLALAQVYSGENRPAETERVLLEIVALRPADKSHRIRLAQFYGHQNQLDAAERVLRDGIKAAPQDRDLKLSLADFLAVRRSPEAAEKELHGMIASDPRDFELKFALAKFYLANKQEERAEKIYREVIDAEKMDAAGIAARDHLASLRAQRNDIKGTEELVGEVLAKSPRDTDALILRGDIALAQKNPKAAIADLRTVLRDQPNSIGVLRTLARAHLANGEPAIAEETMRRAVEANPGDAGLRLDLAQLLAQLNKPEQSKAILTYLVKEQPNNIEALDSLFRVSAATKDFETARSAAEGLVAAQPKMGAGYLYEGMLAEEAKHNDEALRLYGQAAALQPDALEPLQAQIRLLVATKRLPEALRRLDDLTAADPKNAFAPNIKGDVLLTQKDLAGAQGAFKIAIERAPAWFAPYRGLAAAQAAAKDTDAALATLRKAESAVAQPEPVGIEIASYLEGIGRPQEAIREYDAIVRRNPGSDVAANNLAMLLVTYGKDAASLDRAKSLSARFADSSNPSFLDTYGWVLFKHGEAAASVPVLQRVASKSPDAPVVLYHLGMAQSQSGSTAQALDNLTRAVKSGAKFSGLDEAKATLDKLAKLPSDTAPKT
ncbi:MAG TPA: tetratricopeptide repeat protein [Steroidobacteraceae bacterium]|nr:tetratricopeptide repeat protein [Steroidobacteraceae bacterium]